MGRFLLQFKAALFLTIALSLSGLIFSVSFSLPATASDQPVFVTVTVAPSELKPAPEPGFIERWKGTLETLAIVITALWGLYVYRATRKGEVTVGIEATRRLHRPNDDSAVLLIALKINNPSSVLFAYREASLTLMDAGQVADGHIQLIPFAQADPFGPVYGEIEDDSDEIAAGNLFREIPEGTVSIEPGEAVNTEVSFPLDPSKLGLMAARVSITGSHGTGWLRRPYTWASFFYIDPKHLENEQPEAIIGSEQ
jgi:hypothetical protein